MCTTLIVLQASCTDTVRQSIMEVLKLQGPVLITASLNRHNIG
jgi:superfamily II DNA helicase RecQ